MIEIKNLIDIPAIENGLDLLKSDIENMESAFCICMTAREYQVGAADAMETLERATGKNGRKKCLEKIVKHEQRDDTIYLSITENKLIKEKIDLIGDFYEDEIERVYKTLKQIHKSYGPGKRLASQSSDFRLTYITAFQKLRLSGLLPPTTGNSAYNHQGMFLLMESCFKSYDDFISYLKNPNELDSDEVKAGLIRNKAKQEVRKNNIILTAFLFERDGLALEILFYLRRIKHFSLKKITRDLNISMPEFIDTITELKNHQIIDVDRKAIYLTKKGKKVLKGFS